MSKYRRKALAVSFISAFLFVTVLCPVLRAQDPMLGEIRMFAGNFAPRGWALCDGQLLQISQNSALFSILGTTFGGDGRVTFGLPDLRGRLPMHVGQGAGLTDRRLGQKGGVETVTLHTAQMPSHTHAATAQVGAADTTGTSTSPAGKLPADDPREKQYTDSATNVTMNAAMVSVANEETGGSQAHENLPPFQAVTFIIALQGTYPSRN